MTAIRALRLLLVAILSLACIWLGWGLWQQMQQPLVEPVSHREVVPQPPLVPSLPVEDRGDGKATLSRPLFWPSRRPIRQEQATPIAPQGLKVEVLGVVMTPEDRIAILRQADGEVTRVSEGDTFRGWRVIQIKPRRVLFRRGKELLPVPYRSDQP